MINFSKQCKTPIRRNISFGNLLQASLVFHYVDLFLQQTLFLDWEHLTYAACIALAQHVQTNSDKCQALFISPNRRRLRLTYRWMIQIANELSIEDKVRIHGFNPRYENIGQDLKTIFPNRRNKKISKESKKKWLCPHILMNDPRGMFSLITEPDVISIITGV